MTNEGLRTKTFYVERKIDETSYYVHLLNNQQV